MDFFKGIGNFFGNLFGGGNRDEEERKRREQQQRQTQLRPTMPAPQPSAPVNFGASPQQNPLNQPLNQPQQPANSLNLFLPGSQLQKSQPVDTRNDKEKEIDRLAAEKMAEARKEAESGQNWFERNLLNRGSNEDLAKVGARNKAVNAYQEKYGWNRDEDVLDYIRDTSQLSKANSEKIKKSGERLDTFAKGMDKVGEVAQYVPITGSVLNLGLAGSEKLAKATGNDAYARDINNQRNKNEFGMTTDELEKLDPETQGKLQIIRKAGYVLSPLDVLGFGGLAKAEGVNVAKNAAVQLAKTGTVDAATRTAVKEGVKQTAKELAVPTAIGTGVGLAGQQYLTGEMDPLEAAKGGLMVGGTSLLFPGRNLSKRAADTASDAARVADDVNTVAPGVKSANPNREADAAAANAAEMAKAAEIEQARVEAEQAKLPASQRTVNMPAEAASNPMMLEKAPAPAPAAAVIPEVMPTPQVVADVPPVAAVAPDAVPVAPGVALPEAAPITPGAVPELPAAAVTPEVPVAPVVDEAITDAPVAPVDEAAPGLPQMPQSAEEATVDIAPRTHDMLVKQLGPAPEKELKGKYAKKIPLNIEDLKAKAAGVIANMDDESLVKSFAGSAPETMITDSQSFSLARAALERLSQNADDPAAVQTVSNIMEAMDRYVSKSGEGLRIVQEEFDNMPLPMKVRYIVKKIDRANADVDGYQPLSDDPARAAIVEANITGRLQASQAIAERVAQTEGQLNAAADAAQAGEQVDVKPLVKLMRDDQRLLAENDGELVKYYQELMPKRGRGQRANDFARSMMLASFTGRVNDVIGTSANVVNLALQNATQSVMSKAVNLFKPGAVTDTSKGGSKIFTGAAEGLRKTIGEFRGKQYAPDIQRALDDNTGARTGLQKTGGKINRTVQAATEAATNLSEGVRDQRLYQLADKEAAQAGLKGALRKQYAEARAAVPSRQMIEAADQLHKEINNLNENPVTRGLNRVASGIEGKSAIGGFLKNQIMPFTSWLGGNIYNSITDKNVVASFVKTLDSARKGDAEGITRNLAKTANNAAYTYALGYLLTEAGVLTNEDAQGYNDAGAYLHVGDRYIPVGFTGFFAPSIILGNAAYNGMNNPEGGSVSEKIVDSAAQGVTNFAKFISLNSALGADNNVTRSIEAANRPGGDVADGAATFGAGAAGQFIPGFFGDVNAVLNNGLNIGGAQLIPDSLNPTHEAADTKVVDPNSPSGQARDVPKSALEGLKNRIPFLSQTLPRKKDVAAADLVDRTTKGNRDTPGGKEAKAQEQAKVDREKDFEARGIPNWEKDGFETAVKARVEAGEYDSAIEGLQAKLDAQKGNKDIPASKNKELEDEIKTLKVTDDRGYKPEVIALYKDTNLTEWRNMGDPESDDYNPELYELLYNYDSDLANAGVSRNNTKADKNFYSAKVLKGRGGKGGRGSAESRELSRIKSNTIGNTPGLAKISLGDLRPEKAGSQKMPTIQQIKPGELIKKRKITVGKA